MAPLYKTNTFLMSMKFSGKVSIYPISMKPLLTWYVDGENENPSIANLSGFRYVPDDLYDVANSVIVRHNLNHRLWHQRYSRHC